MQKENAKYIIFFDQDCGLCSRSVRILHRLDGDNCFLFAPLGGETFHKFALTSPPEYDSFIALRIVDQQPFCKSRAWLQLLPHLGCCGKLVAGVLAIMPRCIPDAIYDLVARNRHKFFPMKELCSVPDDRLQKKLLR